MTEAAVCEHPPAPLDMGQLLATRIVQELMGLSAWESTAMFVTYDEGGGFFERPTFLKTYRLDWSTRARQWVPRFGCR